MRTPSPMPRSLQGQPLTPATLQRTGLSRERLRRADVAVVARGIYGPVEKVQDLSPVASLGHRAALAARTLPGAWISNTTAAQLRSWWLPARLEHDPTIHLSFLKSAHRRTVRAGIRAHRMTHTEQRTDAWHGAPMSQPARTWLELASLLSVQELIILGDHVVRHPYPKYEGRAQPWTTLEQLQDYIRSSSGMRGIRAAREAVEQIRTGADSVAETLLRLALVGAGLPEPELQVSADPNNPRSPRADLGYPRARIAIQYDGASHFFADQARKDQRRDNAFIAAGWYLLKLNREDAAEGFTTAVAQIRALLASAW